MKLTSTVFVLFVGVTSAIPFGRPPFLRPQLGHPSGRFINRFGTPGPQWLGRFGTPGPQWLGSYGALAPPGVSLPMGAAFNDRLNHYYAKRRLGGFPVGVNVPLAPAIFPQIPAIIGPAATGVPVSVGAPGELRILPLTGTHPVPSVHVIGQQVVRPAARAVLRSRRAIRPTGVSSSNVINHPIAIRSQVQPSSSSLPQSTVIHDQVQPSVRSVPQPAVTRNQGKPRVSSVPQPTVNHYQVQPDVSSVPQATVTRNQVQSSVRLVPARVLIVQAIPTTSAGGAAAGAGRRNSAAIGSSTLVQLRDGRLILQDGRLITVGGQRVSNSGGAQVGLGESHQAILPDRHVQWVGSGSGSVGGQPGAGSQLPVGRTQIGAYGKSPMSSQVPVARGGTMAAGRGAGTGMHPPDVRTQIGTTGTGPTDVRVPSTGVGSSTAGRVADAGVGRQYRLTSTGGRYQVVMPEGGFDNVGSVPNVGGANTVRNGAPGASRQAGAPKQYRISSVGGQYQVNLPTVAANGAPSGPSGATVGSRNNVIYSNGPITTTRAGSSASTTNLGGPTTTPSGASGAGAGGKYRISSRGGRYQVFLPTDPVNGAVGANGASSGSPGATVGSQSSVLYPNSPITTIGGGSSTSVTNLGGATTTSSGAPSAARQYQISSTNGRYQVTMPTDPINSAVTARDASSRVSGTTGGGANVASTGSANTAASGAPDPTGQYQISSVGGRYQVSMPTDPVNSAVGASGASSGISGTTVGGGSVASVASTGGANTAASGAPDPAGQYRISSAGGRYQVIMPTDLGNSAVGTSGASSGVSGATVGGGSDTSGTSVGGATTAPSGESGAAGKYRVSSVEGQYRIIMPTDPVNSIIGASGASRRTSDATVGGGSGTRVTNEGGANTAAGRSSGAGAAGQYRIPAADGRYQAVLPSNSVLYSGGTATTAGGGSGAIVPSEVPAAGGGGSAGALSRSIPSRTTVSGSTGVPTNLPFSLPPGSVVLGTLRRTATGQSRAPVPAASGGGSAGALSQSVPSRTTISGTTGVPTKFPFSLPPGSVVLGTLRRTAAGQSRTPVPAAGGGGSAGALSRSVPSRTTVSGSTGVPTNLPFSLPPGSIVLGTLRRTAPGESRAAGSSGIPVLIPVDNPSAGSAAPESSGGLRVITPEGNIVDASVRVTGNARGIITQSGTAGGSITQSGTGGGAYQTGTPFVSGRPAFTGNTRFVNRRTIYPAVERSPVIFSGRPGVVPQAANRILRNGLLLPRRVVRRQQR